LRILAVIELLGDLAVDVELPVDDDNPLRQVIINTHSPSVVACVHDDALLVAQTVRELRDGIEESKLSVRHLPDTWRHRIRNGGPEVTRGDLIAYLNPLAVVAESPADVAHVGASPRVMERKDMQMLLPFPGSEGDT
jgi:hypothetical protein